MDAALNQTRLQMLGELAELGLVLARDLQQAALQAGDMDEKVRLAGAFHRIGRAVRQSLALHARLERDAHRAAREDEAEVISLDNARRLRRKAQIKAAVERLVWTEAERLEDEPDELLEDLEVLLDSESEAAGFLEEAPDAVIARLCQVLKVPGPPPQGEVAAGRSGLPPATLEDPAPQPPQSVPDSSPGGGASSAFRASG